MPKRDLEDAIKKFAKIVEKAKEVGIEVKKEKEKTEKSS